MIARPTVVLPLPLSPTSPTVWPRWIFKRNIIHRLHLADLVAKNSAENRKVDFQVLDFQQRCEEEDVMARDAGCS